MKKITTTISIFLFTLGVNAQVGIGNVTPDNNSILDLRNSSSLGLVLPVAPGIMPVSPDGIVFFNTTLNKIFYKESGGYNALSPWRYKFNGSTSNNTYFTLGNVGVNTTLPQTKLHISGGTDMLTLEGTTGAGLSIYHSTYASGVSAQIFSNSTGDLYLKNTKNARPLYIQSTGGGAININSASGTPQVLITGSNISSTSNTFNVQGKIKENGNDLLPTGVIVMWSGTTAPAGWAICNGGSGTPNLQGRFVMGMGTRAILTEKNGVVSTSGTSTYSVNTSGGSDRVELIKAQMPAHNHGGATGSAGVHNHIPIGSSGTGTLINSYRSFGDDDSYSLKTTGTPNAGFKTSSDGAHTHTVAAEGSGSTIRTQSPFYVLAYIMKL